MPQTAVPYGHTPPKQFRSVIQRKAAALWWLADHGGVIESKSGQATAALAEKIAPISKAATNFTSQLVEMENDGLILRDVNGRRTNAIHLVLDRDELVRHPVYGANPWIKANGHSPDLRIVAKPEAEREPEPEPEPEPEVSVPAPGPAYAGAWAALEEAADEWQAPAVALTSDPHLLLSAAMSYIAQAMASSQPVTAPDPQVLRRLSDTLEDNQRLRAKLSARDDELAAVKGELTGLRKAKSALEENLRTIAAGRLDEAALRRFNELDRMVRSAPTSAKGE